MISQICLFTLDSDLPLSVNENESKIINDIRSVATESVVSLYRVYVSSTNIIYFGISDNSDIRIGD